MTLLQRLKCFFGYHETELVRLEEKPKPPFRVLHAVVCKHCGGKSDFKIASMGDPVAVEDLYPKNPKM